MNNPSGNPIVSRVLLTDDHTLFREGLVSVFNATDDFQVVGGAGTVHECIEMALTLRPDIILMDFSMPDGTGLDATRAILAQMPECKIVFLTIQERNENLFAALRAGAKGYIFKNVSSGDLVASLRALNRGEPAISRNLFGRVVEAFSNMIPAETSENITRIANLTQREKEVLAELGRGATNQEIAQRLYLSENTVKHHVRSILDKLGVKNRRQASEIANQINREYLK